MSAKDFWFRWLPGRWLTRTRNVSLEGRGAYADYISCMREGDGTVPDERTPEGMEWHTTMLAVRDSRTVLRVVGELLKKGKLRRLPDGRMTNDKVEEDMQARTTGGGGGGGGGRGGKGGKAPPEAPLLRTIEGGRSAQATVDKPVDDAGRNDEMADSRSTVGRQSVDRCPSRAESSNEFKGRFDSVEKSRIDSEFAAALMASPRARGDPSALRA